MKTLQDFDFEDQRVVLRVDFNVTIDESSKIGDDNRIRAALPTINYLLSQKVRQLIIMSHLGEPDGKIVPNLTMDKVAQRLSELLEKPVYKTKDCILKRVPQERIILLENLRFHKEETQNSDEFAKTLASYGDIYVNDAFGVCHRNHASVVAITKFLPGCIGLLVQKEIESLDIARMKRPIYALLGGAKLKTKIPLIQRMLVNTDKVLIGGAMIFTFYASQGLEIGESILDKEYLKNAQMMLHNESLILPSDVIVADVENKSINIRAVDCKSIPKNSIGLDIGPQSLKTFKEQLSRAATIIWNGPLGYYEKEPFDKATKEIAMFISELKCDKIVGGGDSVDVINKLKIADKFSFVSSGGGASLELLSGETLPALRALEDE